MAIKTTLKDMHEDAKEYSSKLKVREMEDKLILGSYSIYVFSKLTLNTPISEILDGGDWYEQIYKNKKYI